MWIRCLVISFAAVIYLAGCTISGNENARKPNFILFYIDDLGWTDLGCYGSDLYETPNLDQLAAEGIRFTDAYSACTVCSPSRAALMTGKYPARLHLTDWIDGHKRPFAKLKVPDWQMYLDTTETTIAEILKDNGYVTGIFGKWHLGDDPVYWPENQGFDVNIGGYRWGAPGSYFYPYHGNKRDGLHPPNLEEGKEGEYLTDRLTDEAIKFIEREKDKPFFIYLPHYAVHTPIQAHDSISIYFKEKIKPDSRHNNAEYAAMIHSVDQSVGRIQDKLVDLQLDGHTTIFFTSDNGGLELRNITDNGIIRDGKGSAYEGGVRVPLIISIPGITHAGQVSGVPVIGMDLFATIQAIAGIEVIENDGVNLMGYLGNADKLPPEREIFWHYPHYHQGGATPYSAMRSGNYKLIEFFEDSRLELYDLSEDIAEEHNLIDRLPELTIQLHSALQAWRDDVNAQYPSANPDYRNEY